MNIWAKVAVLSEYLMIGLMLGAGLVIVTIDPPSGAGPLSQAVGVLAASWTYASIYWIECCLWIYARLFNKPRLRKWTLFVIALTHTWTFVLAWVLGGFGINILDNFAIMCIAGWLWLRAKRREYITYEELVHFDD